MNPPVHFGLMLPIYTWSRESIVSFLGDKLPEYMVPGLWVTMESFPLTSNGKIDKRALPDPEPEQGRTGEYVAPRNETERKLAEIWQDLLEVEQVGIHDSFFELGGHSLLTVRLISAIRREFVVELQISAIFDYPTVALLAAEFENLSKEDVLPPVEHIINRPGDDTIFFSNSL